MKILHYTLGLPPYRSGGLTKYATDLMLEQVMEGHNVSLLYPGGVDFTLKTRIIVRKTCNGIMPYEIMNSLPVPLYHGICSPQKFIPKKNDSKIYTQLLDKVQPEIIHLHTLMGLPENLLFEAKKRNIRIVFTTHDFFGLCMKCTFIDLKGELCSGPTPGKCAWCNQNAKSIAFLRFRNQPIVINLKNRLHKSYQESDNKLTEMVTIDKFNSRKNDYQTIIEYYKSLFEYVDLFHFNSIVTETVYRNYLTDIKGKVVPISNSNIGDNRKRGFYDGKTLKIVFIGHTDIFKGFPLLKSVLLELQQYDWELEIWGGNEGIDSDSKKIVYRGRYTASDLEEIYKNTSLVIVPSQWYETFSFVTLEALSYGVPVLVSDKVGAKSIVANYDSSFTFNTKKELKDKLEKIMQNRSDLVSYHNRILSLPWNHGMEEHSNEIERKIYGCSL